MTSAFNFRVSPSTAHVRVFVLCHYQVLMRDVKCDILSTLSLLQNEGKEGRKEMFLFKDALTTFYLRLYGVKHMVKDHSNSERGNPLPPHGLLFPISSKGSFVCTIP